MYTPKTLGIEHLMSYDRQIVDFEEGASIIYGINNSDGGQSGNGSGKSVILEGLVIALTGKPMRPDVVVRDLIRDGEKTMLIDLELYNKMLNTTLSIERIFDVKKSQQVTIKENGEVIETTDANHANTIILEMLDITKEDLLNFYLIDKMKFQSFFAGGDAAKKKVIGRFSNIELITPAIDKIKLEGKTLIEKISSQNILISREEGKIDVYNTNLETEKSRDLDVEKQTAINKINTNLEKYRGDLLRLTKAQEIAELEIAPQKEEIEDLEERLRVGTSMIGKIDTVKLEKERDDISTTLNQIKDKIAEGNRLLQGSVICPKCEHEFPVGDPSKDLKKVTAGVAMLTEMKESSNLLYISAADKVKKVGAQKTRLETLKSEVNVSLSTAKRELSAFETTISTAETQIGSTEQMIKAAEITLKAAEGKVLATDKKSIEANILEADKAILGMEKEIEVINGEIDKNAELEGHFNRFKTQLVNKTVGVIEFYTNKFLEEMRSSLSVTISGYKEKRGGGLSEKISTIVNRDGVEVGNAGRFSQGERGRIDIAGILALQSQINAKSSSGGLNLLFLDEIVESIDEEGITGILSAVDNLGKCIYIVTHSVYEGNHNKVIEVMKDKNNVSKWQKRIN